MGRGPTGRGGEPGGKWSWPFLRSDLDSASVDSDMYDLPKKEDALLYQSKGKAGVGGHPDPFVPVAGRT